MIALLCLRLDQLYSENFIDAIRKTPAEIDSWPGFQDLSSCDSTDLFVSSHSDQCKPKQSGGTVKYTMLL
jgi:hypothetical protein